MQSNIRINIEAEPGGLWVIEVNDFGTIEVEFGASDAYLPETAILILSDNSEAYVPVYWSGEIDIYTSGTQTFIGTLDLSEFKHVEPTDLTATVQVIVKEAE